MTNKNQQLDEFAPPANSATVEPSAGLLPDGTVDREGAMAKADLYKLSNYSYKLFKKLNDEDQLDGWVQAKITKAADYIASVYHYLEYEMKFSEYGKKLESSDMYTESEKQLIQQKLSEARSIVKALKVTQANKLLEGKLANKDFAALAAPVDKITYADKIAGANKKAKSATAKVAKEGLAEANYSDDDDYDYVKRPHMPKVGKYSDHPGYDEADAEEDAEKAYKAGIEKRKKEKSKSKSKELDEVFGSRKAARLETMEAIKPSEMIVRQRKTRKKQPKDTDKFGGPIPPWKKGTEEPLDKMEESKPSAGLSNKKKSKVVKAAKNKTDLGKPGKNFDKVADKAAKKYGSKEKGEKVAAAAMWKNIKESVEMSFGEGVYETDTQQIEDLSGEITKLNKPEKFAQVKPLNIKGARPKPDANGISNWEPDPDERSVPVAPKQTVHPAIAKLQGTHPKLYAYLVKTPGASQKFLSNSSYAIDLLTKPEFQPVFKEEQLDEADLKKLKSLVSPKQSAFSKKGYAKLGHRLQYEKDQAIRDIETADEKGDNAGVTAANRQWKDAHVQQQKVLGKKEKAKKESINESVELSAIKTLSGL